MGRGFMRRGGKGIEEEENGDDEKVWQERVDRAYRRVEGVQEERAAAASAMAERGGKAKKKDGYGDWSGRRERERDRGREREGGRGGKGVMTSTILEEESSSGVGF